MWSCTNRMTRSATSANGGKKTVINTCTNTKTMTIFTQDERNREGKDQRGRWRLWLWQSSPGGLWDSLSEAIPSMGGLIRFITSQISGGACCQLELSAWPVIRASNEDRTSLKPGRGQMTPRPWGVQSVSASHGPVRELPLSTNYAHWRCNHRSHSSSSLIVPCVTVCHVNVCKSEVFLLDPSNLWQSVYCLENEAAVNDNLAKVKK